MRAYQLATGPSICTPIYGLRRAMEITCTRLMALPLAGRGTDELHVAAHAPALQVHHAIASVRRLAQLVTGHEPEAVVRHRFFFSSRRRHTRSVSAFLLNRSSDLNDTTDPQQS